MTTRARPVLGVVAQLRPTGTSQEAVLAELRRVLVSGRIKPGSLLPLDKIAQAFGVSITPVREALKTLQGEGLIRHSHRGGYLVPAVSRDEPVEVQALRQALDGVSLARAQLADAGAAGELPDPVRAAAEQLDRVRDRLLHALDDDGGKYPTDTSV